MTRAERRRIIREERHRAKHPNPPQTYRLEHVPIPRPKEWREMTLKERRARMDAIQAMSALFAIQPR